MFHSSVKGGTCPLGRTAMNKMTTLRLIARLLAVLVLIGHPASLLAQGDYRITFVKNKKICLTGPTKIARCITSDNREKYLPVWSRDGSKIAYIEVGDSSSSLATVYVIDRDGNRIAGGIPIPPISSGEIRCCMRYVESMEWISSNRLAVSGSINPSQAEYVLINVDAAEVTDDFVSDEVNASFSADGLSYAAVTGTPHFSSKEDRAPTLVVDGRKVADLVPAGTEVAGSPTWAPDGSAIALPLRNWTSDTGVDSVVVWERNSGLKYLIQAPAQTRDIRWGGKGLIATTLPEDTLPGQVAIATHGWEVPITHTPFGISGWRPVADPTLLNVQRHKTELRELRDSLEIDPGTDIDVWCASCGFSNLPRRVPHHY